MGGSGVRKGDPEAGGACCSPSRETPGERREPEVVGRASATSVEGMVELAGGRFLMGSEDGAGYAADGEGPVRAVTLRPFWIGITAVSNARFASFAEATSYTTDAERSGWSFVFAGLLPEEFPDTRGVFAAPWWRQAFGADWRHPEGPQSSAAGREDHPVVHVSWRGATAYCNWAGLRLPTEAEWEYAARGGLEQARYPWGDEPTPNGEHRCNVWQGEFPKRNTLEDGYYGTAPVRAFPANGYGLYNTCGNVWEWCADWFSPAFHAHGPSSDPKGPPAGTHRVIRGGSYLCHESYCFRYRVAARSANTSDSTTGNVGFRCA